MDAKRALLASCLGFSLGLPLWSAAQGLVVFGTSLSDPGNAYQLLGEANTPPDWSGDQMFLVPERPYARGGRHFSNGATWIEQMARPLGLAASAKGAFTPGGGANFAVGGARARDFNQRVNLSDQVQAFLRASGDTAPGAALYVIEMGGNDIRDALEAFTTLAGAGKFTEAELAAGNIITDAVSAIGVSLATLHEKGARRFLVWHAPDIGVTPAVNRSADAAALAKTFAEMFNNALESMVLQPLDEAADTQVARFDVNQVLFDVTHDGAAFGLSEVTTACLTLEAPFHCGNPEDYLFWDGIHPTKAGHAILAQRAAAALVGAQ